jgi:hypothetical protein
MFLCILQFSSTVEFYYKQSAGFGTFTELTETLEADAQMCQVMADQSAVGVIPPDFGSLVLTSI